MNSLSRVLALFHFSKNILLEHRSCSNTEITICTGLGLYIPASPGVKTAQRQTHISNYPNDRSERYEKANQASPSTFNPLHIHPPLLSTPIHPSFSQRPTSNSPLHQNSITSPRRKALTSQHADTIHSAPSIILTHIYVMLRVSARSLLQ